MTLPVQTASISMFLSVLDGYFDTDVVEQSDRLGKLNSSSGS